MRRWSSVFIALCLAGIMAAPAAAVDVTEFLSVTGFVDNHIRYYDNISAGRAGEDESLVTDDDDELAARTRARLFFHAKPNAFSKAVIGFEIDQAWGDPGFDFGIDNLVLEVKHAYVDVKIPNTPISFLAGGFAVNPTPLKSCIIFCDDAGGVVVRGKWSPQFSTYTWFINVQEEFVEEGPDSLGEDITVGSTFQFKLGKGMDIHLLAAWYGLDGPNLESRSVLVGRCVGGTDGGMTGMAYCVQSEQRYYFGVDAKLKFGGLTLQPTFYYLGGTRDLPGGREVDLQSFILDVRGAMTFGPLTVQAKFGYIPGNEADDDLTTGDIHYWQNITVTTVNRITHWFELLGWNIDGTSTPTFGFLDSRSMREAGTFDQFGLIHFAGRVDYKVAKPLTLTASVGAFLTAEDTGRPARFGAVVPEGYNFKGGENHVGTEVDLVLTYQWFKGTTVNLWFAYAAIGAAHDLCAGQTTGANCQELEAEDQIGAGARMIYRF